MKNPPLFGIRGGYAKYKKLKKGER